jgi:hypothetical protein
MPCSDPRDNPFEKLHEYFCILKNNFEVFPEIIKSFDDAYYNYDWQSKFGTTRVLCTAVRTIGYEKVREKLLKNDDRVSYEFLAWIADHREWDKKNGREW